MSPAPAARARGGGARPQGAAPAPPPAGRRAGETLAWIALVALAALAGLRRFDEADTGVHILAGRSILATHRIPDADPFSFTVRGAPWFVNQWIPEVLFAAIHGAAGVSGLIVLRVALMAATFALIALAAKADRATGFAAAFLATLAALYASQNLYVLRPLLFTALFLALETWVLESWRHGGRGRLALLPPLFAVWVNTHAGYVLGAILLAATLAAETAKFLLGGRAGPPLPRGRLLRLAAAAGASIALSALVATLVNPRGFATVLLPFGLVNNSFFLNIIGEYQRADATDLFFWIMAGVAVAGLLIRLARGGFAASDLVDWAVVLPFAYQSWRTHRVILAFAIVAAPAAARGARTLLEVCARALRAAGGGFAPVAARLRGAVPWAMAAAALGLGAWRWERDPFAGFGLSPIIYPRAACLALLREGAFEPNLFHNDLWAGAVALYGWPRYPLFIDGRLEVYGERFWQEEYFRILGCGPGWEEVLDRYGVNAALLRVGSERRRDRLGSVLHERPDWALVYWDETAMLYLRRTPANAAVIAAREAPPEVDPEVFRVPVERAPRERFLAAMDRALAEDPGSILALYGAVTSCAAPGGDAARAARYLPLVRDAERERLNRRDWRLPWLEGRILLAGGDAAGAQAALERAARLDRGEFEELAFDRAVASARRGNRAEAAALVERGAARRAREGNAAAAAFAFRAGRALARAGEAEAARDAYRVAARRDPARADYPVAIAWSLVGSGREEEAVRTADEALARFPNDPFLLGTRGWALFRAGRMAEAESDIRAALARLPAEQATARRAELSHLGEILLARGAVAEAVVALTEAGKGEADLGVPEIERAAALLDSLRGAGALGAAGAGPGG